VKKQVMMKERRLRMWEPASDKKKKEKKKNKNNGGYIELREKRNFGIF